ncbi:hypothetical protein KIL84_005848 [Mauremys mutica]|uniref:Uncharacterized protein n=1 Tax=Mauremys mutica TaxID=74926 RepID=A0A9D3XI70_9SAUR|nr:hypothetical protein KIL84_005848 [Mauremys mutica]
MAAQPLPGWDMGAWEPTRYPRGAGTRQCPGSPQGLSDQPSQRPLPSPGLQELQAAEGKPQSIRAGSIKSGTTGATTPPPNTMSGSLPPAAPPSWPEPSPRHGARRAGAKQQFGQRLVWSLP